MTRALVALVCFVLAGAAPALTPVATRSDAEVFDQQPFMKRLHEIDEEVAKRKAAAPLSGEIARDFAEVATIQNEGTIALAKAALEQSKDGKFRAFLKKMIRRYEDENTKLKRFLKTKKP